MRQYIKTLFHNGGKSKNTHQKMKQKVEKRTA